MAASTYYGDAHLRREQEQHDEESERSSRDRHSIASSSVAGGPDMGGPRRSREPRRQRYDDDRPSRRSNRIGNDIRDRNAGYYAEERVVRRRISDPAASDSRRNHQEMQRREHREQQRPRSQSSRGPDWIQVASTAAVAGAIEAFRSRHNRENTARTITAAAAAGAVDAVVGKHHDGKGGRHVVESVIAGLAVDRLAHGRSR